MGNSTTVEYRGSVFDGRLQGAIRDACQDIERELADQGAAMMRANLGQVLQHPTGFYQSQIHSSPTLGGHWQVEDNGIVYGPWLEGVGSRNRTTRFKGYATFRRTAQQLDRHATEVARRIISRYIRRVT